MIVLLSIWFVVSYLLGIVFVEPLNQFHLGGFPVGFWFSDVRVRVRYGPN
jgi:putative solute:sodium symporter small subunit